TTSCVACAFGVKVIRHPEAERLLRDYYKEKINDARLRMADVPEGAVLIDNPVSLAPGFRIGNVHVLAGVPSICRAMFASLKPGLRGGTPVESVTISGWVGEGQIAAELGAIQARFTEVEIGSYPFFRDGRVGTSLVLRSAEKKPLLQAVEATRQLLDRHHVEPA
ncbi:MAG: competence/damage-inducible protein A, partial [Alphaproteobacteria bacterium]|nr:competence/damage-inducible protein A [Alphaproteobacteria bacterium]